MKIIKEAAYQKYKLNAQLDYFPKSIKINNYDDISVVYEETMGSDFCDLVFEPLSSIIKKKFQNLSEIKYLDLACGTGTFLRRFSIENGVTCFGIDISKEQIKNAKEKVKNTDAKVVFETGDVLKKKLPTDCDLVTMNLDAINHLRNPKDWELLFIRVYKILNQKGLFLFDMNSQSRLLDDWNFPEVIVKKYITYIQIGLKPIIRKDYIRRKHIMLFFSEKGEGIKKYCTIIEQIALPKDNVFEMLSSVGFLKVNEIAISKEIRKKHIFLKNRYFIACNK